MTLVVKSRAKDFGCPVEMVDPLTGKEVKIKVPL
jgi:hypothetical protein